jgi:long-chain fatty acid transport protein
MKSCKLLFVIIIGVLSAVQPASAQTDEELYQGFQFHFTVPGARAMAMGGAFIALADDNSAGFINPAGLVYINKPQLNAEFKLNSIKTMRASKWNSFSTGELTEFSDDTVIPSFAGFSFPFGNITAAFTITNTISYYEEIALEARTIPGIYGYLNPVTGSLDLKGYTFGLSVGLRLNNYWAFGASTGVYLASLSSINSVRIAGTTGYSDTSGSIISQTVIDGSDTAMFFNFGFLFTPSESFRLGTTFMYFPPISLSQDLYLGGDAETGLHYNTITINYDAPDRFGIGLMWKPFEKLTLTADGVLMMYSQLTDVIVASYDYETLGITRGDNISNLFESKNEIELHAGLEYALISGENPFCIRVGFFTQENHSALYNGSNTEMQYRWNISDYSDQIEAETSFGFTGGFGFSLSEAISINAAYIITDYYQQGILTATWKF